MHNPIIDSFECFSKVGKENDVPPRYYPGSIGPQGSLLGVSSAGFLVLGLLLPSRKQYCSFFSTLMPFHGPQVLDGFSSFKTGS